MSLNKEDIIGQLNLIQSEADIQIPFYAYGNNEAACQMAETLATIKSIVEELIEKVEE